MKKKLIKRLNKSIQIKKANSERIMKIILKIAELAPSLECHI